MRRVATALGTLLLALGLVACAPGVTSGTVVDKNYYESYTTTRFQCIAYGNNGICTNQMPVTDYHPERFELVIEGYAEGEHELRQSSHSVRESTYDSVNIGDTWTKEDA